MVYLTKKKKNIKDLQVMPLEYSNEVHVKRSAPDSKRRLENVLRPCVLVSPAGIISTVGNNSAQISEPSHVPPPVRTKCSSTKVYQTRSKSLLVCISLHPSPVEYISPPVLDNPVLINLLVPP